MVADRAILQTTSVRLSLNNEACQSGVIARGGGGGGGGGTQVLNGYPPPNGCAERK